MQPILHQYSRRRRRPLHAQENPMPPTADCTSHKPNNIVLEDEVKLVDVEKVEVAKDGAEDSDEEEEEDFLHEQEGGGCKCGRSKNSRVDAKCRKAMLKLGMEPVSGVKQVTVRRKETIYEISEPDVFKSPTAETYVVFGKAKMAKLQIQEQSENLVESSTVADEEDVIDESGLNPLDIELVMTQTGASRVMAVKALNAAENDIVTAIMELMD